MISCVTARWRISTALRMSQDHPINADAQQKASDAVTASSLRVVNRMNVTLL
jgi:hypothetical protein